jgi:rhodanese-related sulfurtransferase
MFRFLTGGPKPATSLADIAVSVAEGRMALIDVREAAEVKSTGKARGAIHIPLGLIPVLADPAAPGCPPDLKAGKPVAVYCASGARSGMAAATLRKLGHAEVTNIGGLSDWRTAGGQIDPA